MKLYLHDHRSSTDYDYVSLAEGLWRNKLPLKVLVPKTLPAGAKYTINKGTIDKDQIEYTTDKGQIADATHLIVHLSSTQLGNLKQNSGDWVRAPLHDQIVLCLTSQHGSLGTIHQSKTVQVGGYKRVILFATHESRLADERVFRSFCLWQPDDAEKFVNGLRDDLPDALRGLFQVSEKPLLRSLAVLCQGFLAVYAVDAEKHSAAVGDEATKALKMMGWYPAPGGGSQAEEVERRKELSGELAGHLEDVKVAKFWGSVLGEPAPVLETAVKSAIEESGGTEVSKIQALLKEVIRPIDSTSGVQVKTVANAYLELVKVMKDE